MTRVYRWDGKEIFINPANVMFAEYMADQTGATEVTMVDGKTYRLSGASYEVLTGERGKKSQGKAGFDVL